MPSTYWSTAALLGMIIGLQPGRCLPAEGELPSVGDKAAAFQGVDLAGKPFQYQPATGNKTTVLVFLRGFPGYQCPICSRQVGELVKHAEALKEAGAEVIMIYPGAAEGLLDRAKQFAGDAPLPAGFTMVVDRDYSIVNLYNLRWDAERETAYPSTLVIDSQGVIRYAKISKTHGDRAPWPEVFQAVKKAD